MIASTNIGPARSWGDRIRPWLWPVGFTLLVFIPILLMQPGKVEADTKSYLYFDPGRLLARVGSVWDPSFGMGTLTHQTIGYLFPMGPWFWFFEQVLGLPAWVAQRLWLGTIIVSAGFGIRYLLRTFEVGGAGVPVGMLAYSFSPYVLGYAGFYSLLLGPWAALPWWIAFVALGLRRGGWKYPALFALTVQLVGSLNGSALIFAMVGPALWILYAVLVTGEATWRKAWGLVWRIGVLTVLTSMWWLSALLVEGKYGVNILRFTESLQTVAATSQPFEILRGLGYWFFYGGDIIGVWNDARPQYTQRTLILFASFSIPALAVIAATLLRWRVRAYFMLLVVAGVIIAVGAAPYDDPSPLGSVFKSFALGSKTGFALRNSNRAVPLVVLGLTMLLAVGVTATVAWLRARDQPTLAIVGVAVVVLLCLVNAWPAFSGGYYEKYLERNERIPTYWKNAIAALDAESHDTRVLALPGSDFSSYRWGDTRDPVEPGFMDRPYVARELVPWGSEQSAAFLMAVDRRLQEGAFEPNALAPVARLMGVGDVVLRMDLQTDRWSLIPAGLLWKTFTDHPAKGLGRPTWYGTTIPGHLKYPEIGDVSRPAIKDPKPPPVAIMRVKDAIPILRTKPTAAPTVIDGDGEGVMDVAGAGLLDAGRLVLNSPSFQKQPKVLRAQPDDAVLVLTDSNRRRGLRWSGLHDRYGYTEQAGEKPLRADPLDQRLDVFPDSTDRSKTVAVLSGVKAVRATTYGSPSFGYAPGQRAAAAFDGDRRSGWLVDAGIAVGPERLRVDLERPVTTGHVKFLQPSKSVDELTKRQNRYISKVGLRFDDGPWITRTLPVASRTKAGGVVQFPRRTFRSLDIRIDGVGGKESILPVQRNPVGFNEITLVDDARGARPVRVHETMLLPRDLLGNLGRSSAAHPLDIVMSREGTMDGPGMNRRFVLPTSRRFAVGGTAVLSGLAKDEVIDQAFDLPDAKHGGVRASSNARLGNPITRASSAIDGDLTTAWVSPIGFVRARMRVQVPDPITVDHLNLQVVADGRHSLPARVRITSADGTRRDVDLPLIPTDAGPGGVASVPISFPALTGKDFKVRVTKIQPVHLSTQLMPVGIAELGMEGVRQAPLPERLPDRCLDDLITVDGAPLPIRVVGTTAEALDGRALPVTACTPGTTLRLGPGAHDVRIKMSPHNSRAIDVSRLLLTSAPAGASPAESVATAASSTPPTSTAPASPAPADAAPRLRVLRQGRTTATMRVDGATKDFWLVLGQSFNKGWVAKVNGKDLGAPKLVDGYANGWKVPTAAAGRPLTITLDWQPQHFVWLSCLLSLAAALLCLGILLVAAARRRAVVAPVGGPVIGFDGPSVGRGVGLRVLGAGVPALIGALFVAPWVGALVGVAALAALARPRLRIALRLAPAVLLAFIALYFPVAQFFNHYPARFDWVTFYDGLRIPTWIAVMLLGADAWLEVIGRIRTRRTDPDGEPDPGQPEG